MAPKRNYKKEAQALSEELRGALKAEVRRRDFRQVDLEEALERSHGYFSHLFGGRLALTIEGVLEVLLAIGADPAEFFALALGAEGIFRKGGPSAEEVEATVLRALRRYGYAPGGEPTEPKKRPRRPRRA
jgi:hypothetical protein